MVPGVGFVFDAKGKVRPGLTNVRRLVGISTYGSAQAVRQGDQRQRSTHDPARDALEHAACARDHGGSACTASTRPRRTTGRSSSIGASDWRGRCERAGRVLPPDARLVHRRIAAARAGRAGDVGARRAAHRPVRRRFPTRASRRASAALDRPPRSTRSSRGDIAGHIENLRWAEALVLVYPTWWAGQPAMLKGWFDRVSGQRGGVAPAGASESHPTAAAQRSPRRRRHEPRLDEARQRARRRGRQARRHRVRRACCATCGAARAGWRCTTSIGRRWPSARRSSTESSDGLLVCETRSREPRRNRSAGDRSSSRPSRRATSTRSRPRTPTMPSSGTTSTRSSRTRSTTCARWPTSSAPCAGRSYDDVRRVILDDGFVQQHVLRGTCAAGALEVPAMLRVWVADGRITRLDEYLDTAQVAVLTRGRTG